MRLLLDMNLSPASVDFLEAEGWETVHWHAVGEPNAPDSEIMVWARAHGYCAVTNDLDFSAILAATRAEGPSVVQIRAQDLAPAALAPTGTVLRQYAASLASGAILTLDARGSRVRATTAEMSRYGELQRPNCHLYCDLRVGKNR
jgi:predicted nuclease of predicted toxin-antitoxin system